MKLIDRDVLVAEIEKRFKEHDSKKYDYASTDHFWKSIEDRDILAFVKSLEVKEWPVNKPVNKDLEQEITKEVDNFDKEIYDQLNVAYTIRLSCVLSDFARHFANWQREQMMKNAVDGVISVCSLNGFTIVDGELEEGHPYKDGDEVKLIIIKED
ncbi:MAG: hypothetical protein K6F74_05375 [Prevotella sp.]|nr:hypothetical protein [Prevotella sp.]